MGWKSWSFQSLPNCVTVSKHQQGKSAPSTGVGASPNTLHQRVSLVTLHRLHRHVCARSPRRHLLILSPVACATLTRLLHGTVPKTIRGTGVGRVACLRSGLCSRRWVELGVDRLLGTILSSSCLVFSPLSHKSGLALLVAIVGLGWGRSRGGWDILRLCLGPLFSLEMFCRVRFAS